MNRASTGTPRQRTSAGRRDRCYLLCDGQTFLRVRAAKRPSKKTQSALLDLLKAATKHLATLPPQAD